MLIPHGSDRFPVRSTGHIGVEKLEKIMEILDTSETMALADSQRGSRCTYTTAQLFAVNLLREAYGRPYGYAKELLTDELCEVIGLPMGHNGYRKPSTGSLNNFVNKIWPKYAEEFTFEYVKAVLLREIEDAFGILITFDGTPLEASRYNFDAEYNGHYHIRMDKMHIVMANGTPLFGIQTGANVNDSLVLRALCDLLRKVPGLGDKVKVMMDAGYDSFHCYAEAFMATGVRPRCVIRADAVYHQEADWNHIQRLYSRLHSQKGFDPYKKNDEAFVLRFLMGNGHQEIVGKYLRNCEIERQASEGRLEIRYAAGDGEVDVGSDVPDMGPEGVAQEAGDVPTGEAVGTENRKKDTDRQVCETVHHAMKRWVRFDIRGMRHSTRELTLKFRFSVCQVLSAIFAPYTDGPTL